MNAQTTCPPAFLALAHAMADAAAETIRPWFRKRIEVDAKADASPVTIADRNAETVMRRMIEDAFPEHGIRGEEFGACRTDAEWIWVLDPIDGTKSFLSGSLAFGTQIALLHRGRPVLGLINQPITRERWLGTQAAATINGERLTNAPKAKSQCSGLSTMLTGTPACRAAATKARTASESSRSATAIAASVRSSACQARPWTCT